MVDENEKFNSAAFTTTQKEPDRQHAALKAARFGEQLIESVRAGAVGVVEELVGPGSRAALALDLFGLALFRLDLRLDDPRENGLLAPYDLQIESEIALLEVGVVLAQEATEPGGRGHLTRLFGSGIVLRSDSGSENGWLVEEVLPINADGQLRPDDPSDRLILETYQGQRHLDLRYERLDSVESLFLEQMQAQAGRFNLEELFNAVRLWRDFRAGTEWAGGGPEWAAAVEYLITLFDYHFGEVEELVVRYETRVEAITDSAREIAEVLRVTQFDDRYSVHPDPIAHYRTLFGELGIDPHRDEKLRLTAERSQVFDTVEVPPDDDDFWGPS